MSARGDVGHTAGPWTYELDVVDDGDINIFATGMPATGIPGLPIAGIDVLSEPGAEDGPPREIALANARLIAAAPELLAALEMVAQANMITHKPGESWIGWSAYHDAADVMTKVRAALAKVRA